MLQHVNGSWLPTFVSVCLVVTLGGQTLYISFGVVNNMVVSAVLGTSFMDFATTNIATQEQRVELLNRTKVVIRRDAARKGNPAASIIAVSVCPQGSTSKLKPARKTCLQPGPIVHISMRSTYKGHGYVKGSPPFDHNNGEQVAQGPAIIVAREPFTVHVMQLSATPFRLTTVEYQREVRIPTPRSGRFVGTRPMFRGNQVPLEKSCPLLGG